MAWAPPPADCPLKDGEVHVWRVPLEHSDQTVARLSQFLSADERARAERYRFPKHNRQFRVSRAILRVLLGRYLSLSPQKLGFGYGDYGKPKLSIDHCGAPLQFNVSHSGEGALFAITSDWPIGVDVEQIHDKDNLEDLARRFFAPLEVESLLQVPAALRRQAFFNCWTRKEAYLKGCGEGLSRPLDQFVVSLVPGDPPALVQVANDPHEPRRWRMEELLPWDGYVGCVAVASHEWRLRLFDGAALVGAV